MEPLRIHELSKIVYIQFLTDEDCAQGVELLRERHEIAMEGDVYCVPIEGLAALEERNICYNVTEPESLSTGRGWRIFRLFASGSRA